VRDRLIFSPWLSLAPALALIVVLMGASLAFGLAQSLGLMTGLPQESASLKAYADLFSGQGIAGREFWGSLSFSLWVSLASTLLSAFLALLLAFWASGRRLDVLALNANLAFPHLIWAVMLLLLLSQSGLMARWAAALGWINQPAEFPVLVRDRFGVGIILSYIGKEVPFLALLVISVLRTQPVGYQLVAENLGASRWQRIRYVTLPLVMPALLSGSLLVFAFVFSSYEVPALLGVNYPRMLPVLALRFFNDPDLNARADGMAISLLITVITLLAAVLSLKKGEQK
jgi:putative spermidine/putrescine transport system permease protein